MLSFISQWKKSSFWGPRPVLVPCKPKMRARTQNYHAINLAFKAPVVQHHLCSCPAHDLWCASSACTAAEEREWEKGCHWDRSLLNVDCISLGLGVRRLSVKLPSLFPGSSQSYAGTSPQLHPSNSFLSSLEAGWAAAFLALILIQSFPQVFLLTFMVAIFAPNVQS